MLLQIFGFIILFAATDVGRKEESKINFMSGKWWLILTLLVIGSILTSSQFFEK
jgi:hypothetical protein